MSFITDIFSNGIDKVVDSVGNAIDKLVTSDEERLLLRNELAKIQIEAKNKKDELDLQYEQEITKRHQADMASDSWLSKNIRPLFLVWVMFILTLMIGFDGNLGTFKINDGYIKLIESLAITAVVAYFGGRSFDKWNSRKS